MVRKTRFAALAGFSPFLALIEDDVTRCQPVHVDSGRKTRWRLVFKANEEDLQELRIGIGRNALIAYILRALVTGAACIANPVTAFLTVVYITIDAVSDEVYDLPSCVIRNLTAILNTLKSGVLVFSLLVHRHGRRLLLLLCAAHSCSSRSVGRSLAGQFQQEGVVGYILPGYRWLNLKRHRLKCRYHNKSAPKWM